MRDLSVAQPSGQGDDDVALAVGKLPQLPGQRAVDAALLGEPPDQSARDRRRQQRAVLFGLSMDYEVFLVSRIREARAETRDDVEAVARGMAATGPVITSAALIMLMVFLAFVANPSPFVKMIGLGLAVAIALDATVVRMVLVPATMAVLGRANWWLPGWLDRLLPGLQVEARIVSAAPQPGADADAPRPQPVRHPSTRQVTPALIRR